MKKQAKVGVFVVTGLLLLGAGIFLIGENRKFWEPKVMYAAAFQDVQGLRAGAVVRRGGIDIGNVASIGHNPDDPDDARIFVKLSLVKSEAERIRKGTVARVINKGLLGDKLIDLTMVSKGEPQDPAELLPTEEPRDFMAAADNVAGRVKSLVENIEPLTKQLGGKEFGENIRATTESLKASVDSLNRLLAGLADKDSIAHRVFLDEAEGRRFHTLLENVTEMSAQARGVVADAHAISTQVRSGHGAVGAALYSPEMEANVHKSVDAARRTTEALASASEAVNRQDNHGLVHSAIYGDGENRGWITNVTQITADVRDILHGVREGKGTIGALLVDPTVYEDLKSAIGNVERNQVLRAIVRYSIKADETRPKVETPSTH